MASIFPRKGAKGITYEARWNDQDGKIRTKNFTLRKEATAHLSKVGAEDYVADNETPTVDMATAQWLFVCETTGRDGRMPVEPVTLRHYKTESETFRNLILDGKRVGDLRLSKLKQPTMVKIRDTLVGSTSRDAARRSFSRLRSVVREALGRGQIAHDPTRGVAGIQMSSRDREDVVIPQPDEVQTLLATAYEMSIDRDGRTRAAWGRYRLMIECLAFTGMRPSELRGLPRKHVDVTAGVIRIRQRADETGIIGAPKSMAGNRNLVVPRSFMDEMEEWLLVLPQAPETLVFGNGNGNPESLANISNRAWYPLIARSGIPYYNPYTLRHFYASTLIAMGVREKSLQRAMGHERVEMTLNIYGHLFNDEPDQQVARAEQMGSMFGRGVNPTPNQTENAAECKSVARPDFLRGVSR